MRKYEEIGKVAARLADYPFPTTVVTAEEAKAMNAAGRFVVREGDEWTMHHAIEHASKDRTGKGYDTTGYTQQYLVNALNDECGFDGWMYELKFERWNDGTVICEIDLALLFLPEGHAVRKHTDCGVRIAGEVKVTDAARCTKTWACPMHCIVVARHAQGSHRSPQSNLGDAYKGAKTIGFKRACAEFGLGRKAFEAELDPDFAAITAVDKAAPAKPAAKKAPAAKATTKKDGKGKGKATKPQAGDRYDGDPEREGRIAKRLKGFWTAVHKNVPSVEAIDGHQSRIAALFQVYSHGSIDFGLNQQEVINEEIERAHHEAMSATYKALLALKKKPEAIRDLLDTALDQAREKEGKG